MNNEVQILGNVLPQATTKFCVKGKECYSVINISFPPNNCHVKCTNGMCCANLKNKKKIPKHLPVKETYYLCDHLNTLSKHLHYVKSLNILDADHIPQLDGNCNKNTQLWQYKALS